MVRIVSLATTILSTLVVLPNIICVVNIGAVVVGATAVVTASDDPLHHTIDFLNQYKPSHDRNLSQDYIRRNAQLALSAYNSQGWPKPPWEIFLNDVAPYAALSERRTDWRDVFFTTLQREIAGKTTIGDAISVVNNATWRVFTEKPIVFIAAPANEINNYDPFETISGKNTNGTAGSSCTGLAVFLTYAMRSVGIPARVAGTPHWNKGAKVCPNGDADAECGDHNWIEVYNNDQWIFLSPPSATKPNTGWFYPYPTEVQVPLSIHFCFFVHVSICFLYF